MGLHPRWTAHVRDDKRRKDLATAISNSTVMAARLGVMLEEELKAIERSESIEDYMSPSWSHKQAHRNGYFRAITKIKELLEDYDPRNDKER